MSSATEPTPSPAIEIGEVDVRYADRTYGLRDVTLRIDQGERVALIGPSGAGKSTLLKLVCAMVPITSGSVQVLGSDMGALSSRALRRVRRNIGSVSQGLDLPGSLQVVHNVNAGRLGYTSNISALAQLIRPTRRAEVESALASLGLAGMSAKRTDELSGGQQQRVAVARVLYQNPRIMLADEPVSSLDPDTSIEVLQCLLDAADIDDSTLVMSLHDPELAVRFADRIVGIRDGSVVVDCDSTSLGAEQLDAIYRGALHST